MATQDSKDAERGPPPSNDVDVVDASVGSVNMTGKESPDDKVVQLIAEHQDYPPMTPEMEKKIKKKIDAWIIPLCLFTTTMAAVDKVQLSTAALYDFREDNNLTGSEFSWLGSILSVGQVIGLFLTPYIIQRIPPGRLLSYGSLLWSSLTLLYAACSSWGGFMALRFLLGFAESVIFPCLTLIVQAFYKKAEQPPRNAIIFAYFSSVFNGFFSWLVGKIPESAPLARWQYLYLLTGTINICWAIFIYFMLPDSPMNARFLTDDEKYYATLRLAENRTGLANKDRAWNWGQALEAILDVKVWIVFLFNIAVNIPNGGLLTFGSIIIKGLGFNALESSLLTMPFGVFATFSAWVFSYIAAKWHNRRTVVASIALLFPLLGTALMYGLPKSLIAPQMIGLYLAYLYWPPYVVFISLPQANTAGQTKKAVVFAIVNIGYAAGNMIGPQMFKASQAPQYTGGVISMMSCFCISILLALAYLGVSVVQNRRRDRLYGKPEQVQEGTGEGLVGDLSDRDQKESFRYTH
ncbi:related to allantoate permease [Cephalotrichum gorgonifer]|uniref:Related to allantoate permease n=1 Tax=Cephalotrichum gorgonifer TaxID=2041049 RepID=A0AAE8MX96_9PEZI|nr:related to allantoate permease [Cephalotrichum gorgonifer]